MRATICIWIFLGLPLCGSTKAAEVRPLAMFTGADSGAEKRSYQLIQDDVHWRKTWLEHQGRTAQQAFLERLPTLEIDLDRCTVVAIFQGEGINSRALSIEGITEEDTRVVIRFDVWTYQTDAGGGGDRSTTYGFLLLPKTDKPIVLEENTQGLKNHPPRWTRRATLDADCSIFRPTPKPRRRVPPPPPKRPPSR